MHSSRIRPPPISCRFLYLWMDGTLSHIHLQKQYSLSLSSAKPICLFFKKRLIFRSRRRLSVLPFGPPSLGLPPPLPPPERLPVDDPRSLQGQRETDGLRQDGGGLLPRVPGSTRVTAAGVKKENWPKTPHLFFSFAQKVYTA